MRGSGGRLDNGRGGGGIVAGSSAGSVFGGGEGGFWGSGGGAVSSGGVSVFFAGAFAMLDVLGRREGEFLAAAAAWRSFFLRVSSAPRLEVIGKREDEGERLPGRLLWEEFPLAPPEYKECFLVREWEEERRE